MVLVDAARSRISRNLKDITAMGPTRSDSDNGDTYFFAESSLVLDYALGQEARDYVSSFFWDNDEADAVAAVVLAMEDIWDKYPVDASDRAYWTDPDWAKVIELASKAHALMVENDRKHGADETEDAEQDGDKDSSGSDFLPSQGGRFGGTPNSSCAAQVKLGTPQAQTVFLTSKRP